MLLASAGLPAYDAGKLASNAGSGSSVGPGGVGTPTATVASRPSAASALMKTLSVRLHRGTEFIKDTVQKALVMSAPTPVVPAPAPAPKILDHALKRKLSGAGGLMGCSSLGSTASSITVSARSHHLVNQVTSAQVVPLVSQVPTAAFLRTYTVAPTALHRSAAARKRNPSTDSLLMDLCLFKPIRPMPITPIKIHKFRGFELKKPKFVPATNLDSEEDEDDGEDELVHKPKLSNLTLPTTEGSAFVAMPPIETTNTAITATTTTTTNSRSRSRSHNTHTSGSAQPIADPKRKRRRRAPMLTAKRRRKAPDTESTSSADGAAGLKRPAERKASAAAGGRAKRSRGEPPIAATTPADPIAFPVSIKAPTKRKAPCRSAAAKRSRGASAADETALTTRSTTSPAKLAVAAGKSATKRKAATERGAAKRSRGSAASPARPSPPMTRQRARQQISASN
ncbi:uncharacterized protein LOC108091381 [Drosophila ficusphila]|uniref:uncharacterized protein LOC108091381 n=1 Tax=Drosophila ficusphila TaxID=30025 RepID=UPI0007E6CE81|nr:uncharacterized protein LOC108091381 [Drosophila ficusphila]